MSTIFIRYTNRAGFEIYNGIDTITDDVKILDYAEAKPDRIYYIRNEREFESKRIADDGFNSKLIGTTMYRLTDEQVQVLANTGEAIAIGDLGDKPIKVCLAPAAARILERVGNESLARCYAKLAEAREKYKRKQAIQQALLAAATGQPINQPTDTDTLATDIKVFLENRDKCLAALKPKRKQHK